jgi:lipopolysaccharide biosynthesis protein
VVKAFVHRASVALRFVFPKPQVRLDVRKVRESGIFDRDFYLRSNPRLRRLFQLAPERHYVLFGEPAGLCPNPSFSPRAYLHNNPDVDDCRALLHFIQTGRSEGRIALDATPVADLALPHIARDDHPVTPARVAVVLHLFYHDLWEEFCAVLMQQDFAFDLFVTATGLEHDVAPLRARILAAFPRARVWAMVNHGRDIFPFLYVLESGVLAPYRAVCKLHSKRSPHRADGDVWRRTLVDGILGPAAQTCARLEKFLANPSVGLWVADGQIVEGDDWWGVNRPHAHALLVRRDFDLGQGPLRFPAGSVYWLKQPVLAVLEDLTLRAADFEREQHLVDGTTAHAVERIMGVLTYKADLKMCTTRDLDA